MSARLRSFGIASVAMSSIAEGAAAAGVPADGGMAPCWAQAAPSSASAEKLQMIEMRIVPSAGVRRKFDTSLS